MKVFLAVALVGCGASDPQVATSPPPVSQAPSRTAGDVTRAPIAGYRITAITPPLASGNTYASHAICARHAVVGTADLAPNQSHAIVFDYVSGTVTDIGTLPGRLDSRGADGNAAGTIVGSSGGPSFSAAFELRDGVMSELGGIGGAYTDASALDDGGDIVGIAAIPGEGDVDVHAVEWEAGCMNPTDLTALNGGHYSWTRDINSRGEIVGGDVFASVNQWRAVVWRNNVLVELDDHGAPDSEASAINEAGTIAGYIESVGSYIHPVVWRDDQMTDIGTLGGDYGEALGLDARGDVVGQATTAGNRIEDAFLYANGTMTDLNDFVDQTHWWLGQAIDICDDGTIIGNGILDGASRGYVLTPVP